MSEEEFTRVSERTPLQKPLVYRPEMMTGRSNVDILKKYPQYQAAEAAYNNCMRYAVSYSAIMMKRMLEEEPDILEERGLTKPEFEAHLQNNLCLGLGKHRAATMKNTQA